MLITVTNASQSLHALVTTAYDKATADKIGVNAMVVLKNGDTNSVFVANKRAATATDGLPVAKNEAISVTVTDPKQFNLIAGVAAQPVYLEIFP